MARRSGWVALVLAAWVGGCTGPPAETDETESEPETDSETDAPDGPAEVLVTAAAGGLLTSADGKFQLLVMPGALSADTLMSIERVAPEDIPADILAIEPIGDVYSAEPDGLTFGGDGAWVHYVFDPPPASLVTPGDPPTHWSAEVFSRGAAGGPITMGTDQLMEVDEAGVAHVVGRLAHFSLLGAREASGRLGLVADLHGRPERHRVGETWQGTDLQVLVAAWPEGGPPLPSPPPLVTLWVRPQGPAIRVDLPDGVQSDVGAELLDEARARFGLPPAQSATAGQFVILGSQGVEPRTFTPEPPRFTCLRGVAESVHMGPRFTEGESYCHLFEVFDCEWWPAGVVKVAQDKTCRREGAEIACTDPPAAAAEVDLASTQTTVELAPPGQNYVVLTPPAAAPSPGPSTLVITGTGTTATATRDTSTGGYDTVIDDPAIWEITGPVSVTADGGTPVVVDAPSTDVPTFGPVLGHATDVLVSSATPLGTRLRVEWEAQDTVQCQGQGFDDFWLLGFDPVVDLGDGTRGLDAPIERLLESAATFCDVEPSALEATPYFLSVGTSTSDELTAGGTTMDVVVSRTATIDSTSLLATCPPGRTYCTDRCVDTLTDVNHCGGCGRQGVEVCDGADNTCDGTIDEGCPLALQWYAATTSTSPTFGNGGPNSTAIDQPCAFPQVAVGLCGDTADNGNVSALRLRCGTATLGVNTTQSPYDYFVAVAPGPECTGTGGGTPGTPFAFACPTGSLMDHVEGKAGASLGEIVVGCATWDVILDNGLWIPVKVGSSLSDPFGTGDFPPFSWTMPNHAITGFPGVISYMTGRYQNGKDVISLEFRGKSPLVTHR